MTFSPDPHNSGPAVYVHRASRNLQGNLFCGFVAVWEAAGLNQGFCNAVDPGLIQEPRLFLSVTPLTQVGKDRLDGTGNRTPTRKMA